MRRILLSGLSMLAGGTGLFALSPALDDQPVRHKYQRVKPITTKNIGRNWLKDVSRYMPHQGERECARRRRQIAKIETMRGES